MNAALPLVREPAFAPDQPQAYLRWRERKLTGYPRRLDDIVVEMRDPRDPSAAEASEVRRACAIANMAVYAGPIAGVDDPEVVRRLGRRLGLGSPQANPLADADGVTRLEVTAAKSDKGYIPYSNRRLLWHTDGYYNEATARVGAFILHCARPAANGGENRLLDPEIAYILLRDADPAHVVALSQPDAMSVPANDDPAMQARAARVGPVFSAEGGVLHMRYTARTRSIVWRDDEQVRAALRCLADILETSRYTFTVRLEPGQGLVCNNVLHDRSAFSDDPTPGRGRLVYRARFGPRIAPP